jgi:ABC-type lipoprotein release transport system permease subunit
MGAELDRLGAHVLVVPKGCPYDAASIALHGAKWPCYLKSEYLKEVAATPGVATAAPVFMSAVYQPDGKQQVYVGVTPEIQALKRSWHVEGRYPEAAGELLVGSERAASLHWKSGQEVALPGLDGPRGRVVGILAPTGGADDTFITMPLQDAQHLFHGHGQLTHILVRLRDPDSLETTVSQMRSCGAGSEMNIVPLSHLFRTIQGLVGSTRLLLVSVVVVALLVAGAGVSNTMLMAVVERTREIGIMRAVGASRADVFRLFWLESVQVCLVGGAVGVAAAFAGSRILEAWLRGRLPFTPSGDLIRWEWWIAGACLGAVALLGSAAGLLPSWRAARMLPMEAIRAEGAGI